ncbi:MAG: hypothetical protein P8X55_06550 [Desulfosarcinaceae bacterium]
MNEDAFREQVSSLLDDIRLQLARSVNLQEEGTEIDKDIHELEKKHGEATAGLVEFNAQANNLAGQRTDMAKERTALVREQTRLSTKSTELSTIRTDFSRERSSLASQRTNLAVLRTDFSRSRTSLADQRTKMAGSRTRFSEERTTLAGTRTIFSNMRTLLAKGRTYLALVRTGMTFLTLSIALFRIFGVSPWSMFDGVLALGSLTMMTVGLRGYWRSVRGVQTLEGRLAAEDEAVA